MNTAPGRFGVQVRVAVMGRTFALTPRRQASAAEMQIALSEAAAANVMERLFEDICINRDRLLQLQRNIGPWHIPLRQVQDDHLKATLRNAVAQKLLIAIPVWSDTQGGECQDVLVPKETSKPRESTSPSDGYDGLSGRAKMPPLEEKLGFTETDPRGQQKIRQLINGSYKEKPVDRKGKTGNDKSKKGTDNQKRGYIFEHGRNARDYRDSLCKLCSPGRRVVLQGDEIDGRSAADAVLENGTVYERKTWKNRSKLKQKMLCQAHLYILRYSSKPNPWTTGRGNVKLNGRFEFHVDADRLVRKNKEPYTRTELKEWADDLSNDLNRIFEKERDPKGPPLTFVVIPLAINESRCPHFGSST